MTVINEMKSGNVLTKALSPAKTMGKAKGQSPRGTSKQSAPRENPMQSSTKPQMVSQHRHGEYR
jgi:hypothetical protein